MDLIGGLVSQRVGSFVKDEKAEIEDQLSELLFVCRRAEELRNTYLRSCYCGKTRERLLVQAEKGAFVHIEPVSSALLLDVADYIVYAAMMLEGLPLVLGDADATTAGRDFVSYSKEGHLVATFTFGCLE